MATNIKFYKQSTTPVADNGSILFDTTDKALKLKTGGNWVNFGVTKEAFLEWGGKNFAGSYGPIDAAMVPDLGANRFAFINPEGVTIEYTTDGGETWTEYENYKQYLGRFTTQIDSWKCYLGGAAHSGETTRENYQLRITINTHLAKVYTILNKFVIYFSTNGQFENPDCTCTIRGKTRTNFLNNSDTWTVFSENTRLAGWGGYNVINTPSIPLSQYESHTTYYQILQFIFKSGNPSSSNVKYDNPQVLFLGAFGGNGWVTPSNMAKNGHLYAWNSVQDATFPAAITATTGFYLKNSTNDYVLLGAGGTKKISDLTVSTASELTWAEYK